MPTPDAVRLPFHFSRWFYPLAALAGVTRSRCHVDVGADDVTVQMSWLFQGRLPRRAVGAARRAPIAFWRGIGVHGWAGTWAVNGSLHRTVEVQLTEPVRVRVMSVPVRLRRLLLSVDDPDALVSALR